MGTSTQLGLLQVWFVGGSLRTHAKHYQMHPFAPFLIINVSQDLYYNFINMPPILTSLLHVHKKLNKLISNKYSLDSLIKQF